MRAQAGEAISAVGLLQLGGSGKDRKQPQLPPWGQGEGKN